MKRLKLLILVLLGIAEAAYAKKYSLGLEATIGENNRIISVRGTEDRIGLKNDDTILRVNNINNPTCLEIQNEFFSRPGKSAELVFERNGDIKRMTIFPRTTRFNSDPAIAEAIISRLNCNMRIGLIIMVDRISNSFFVTDDWKMAQKTFLETDMERTYLKSFGSNNNFSLLDRKVLGTTLSELRLQETGLMSPETVKNLGKMTGATHLLVVSMSRFPKGLNSAIDVYDQRLIDLETANVIAVAQDRKKVRD